MKESYWAIVEECLVQFHGWSPEAAGQACSELRSKLDLAPADISSEMIYHEEPYYVACRLAKADESVLASHHEKYAQILKKAAAGNLDAPSLQTSSVEDERLEIAQTLD